MWAFLFILSAAYEVVDFHYSGCKVRNGDYFGCYSGKLSDPVPVDLNHQYIIMYCSRGMDLYNMTSFCEDKDLPMCRLLYIGLDSYVEDREAYNKRREANCRPFNRENVSGLSETYHIEALEEVQLC
jgi:hypothetical protein